MGGRNNDITRQAPHLLEGERATERLRKRERTTPFINLLYGPYNSAAFLCIFKSAEDITQKPLLN